jgi:hypothetical protein
MARRFDELALDGHNYPTWALDVKISLTFHGIMAALTPPRQREASFLVPGTIHHSEPSLP